ncbi:MAG TPA: NAD(P)/FAD-dependent oxidoreductase [Alphaproteobacteria bacterium]|nr:NAD(P)/FAD-dependent oxidoreductase [Alphaproteobacteria bacterium]
MAGVYDAIVIGAGHNGLTAAAYLGRARFKTLVLERRHIVGGAAVSEEFHPGYRNSIASYSLGLFRSEISRDLNLKQHGLRAIPYRGAVDLLSDGRAILLTGDEGHDQMVIGRFSNRDYEAMKALRARLLRVGDIVRRLWLRAPPDLAGGLDSLLGAVAIGRQLRKLSLEDRHFLIQMFTLSAEDLAARWFESDTVRQIYTVHCVSSNFASLRAPGSAVPFLLNVMGELDGVRYRWGVAKGGMGAVSEALAASARKNGVEIRTSAPIARIMVENGRAEGVRLESGEEVRARVVLANTDPKRTFLHLVGKEHLDATFAADIERFRMGTASLRMNLALRATPEFSALPGAEGELARGSIINMLPDVETMERNYNLARNGELSDEPYVTIQIASALDDSLAPDGHHVMSLLCKYYPYQLSGGRNWDDIKDQVADRILAAVERHIPNLGTITVARQVLTPLDLERIFGLTEGCIFHGRHELDQLFSLRPQPRAARYRTPIQALYLCGSGSHPGGGVTGGPGHNAAMRVIKDLRRKVRPA